MSTSKVSKYNNHKDNIIITISNFSNPSTVHQTYYKITAMDKSSLISESVAVTRIDIHSARERTWPTRHTLDSWRLSRMTIFCMSLLNQNWALLPRWSLGPRPHSPTKSKSTTRSREVRFDQVVIKSTLLIGPHKNPTCSQYTTQGLSSGPKRCGP
jgi:hypothetical protein